MQLRVDVLRIDVLRIDVLWIDVLRIDAVAWKLHGMKNATVDGCSPDI
jgi:hypothetical protein